MPLKVLINKISGIIFKLQKNFLEILAWNADFP